MELPGPLSRIPRTTETGELVVDFGKTDPITAVVASGRTEGQLAAGIDLRHDLRDLPDLVVVRIMADVEYLAADGLQRRFEDTGDGLADVQHMHQRAPGRAVARHHDPACRRRDAAEIVQHDIEAHPRRRAIGGSVAQE